MKKIFLAIVLTLGMSATLHASLCDTHPTLPQCSTPTPGPEGPAGPQGPQGVPGQDGADGQDGQDGADGADGQDGKTGLIGLPGIKGGKGNDGVDGTNGADGKDGTNGSDGKSGNSGIDGSDGSTGDSGVNGKDGKDGDKGDKGDKGDEGNDGKDLSSASLGDTITAVSAGNTAMATIDFGSVAKGRTQVGVGAGYSHTLYGSDTAGALGTKHGFTDDTAGVAKVWAADSDNYGGGVAIVYEF